MHNLPQPSTMAIRAAKVAGIKGNICCSELPSDDSDDVGYDGTDIA